MSRPLLLLPFLLSALGCGGAYESKSFGYRVRFPSGTVSPETYEDTIDGVRISIARVMGGSEIRLAILALRPHGDMPVQDPGASAEIARQAFVRAMADGAHKFKCSRIGDRSAEASGVSGTPSDERYSCPDYELKAVRVQFRGEASGVYIQIAFYRPESDYSRTNVDTFFSSFAAPRAKDGPAGSLASVTVVNQAIARALANF